MGRGEQEEADAKWRGWRILGGLVIHWLPNDKWKGEQEWRDRDNSTPVSAYWHLFHIYRYSSR